METNKKAINLNYEKSKVKTNIVGKIESSFFGTIEMKVLLSGSCNNSFSTQLFVWPPSQDIYTLKVCFYLFSWFGTKLFYPLYWTSFTYFPNAHYLHMQRICKH